MKTRIKSLVIVSLMLVVAFVACENDDNGKLKPTTVNELSGTVVSANPIDADSIYAVTDEDLIVGKGPFDKENSKFTLTMSKPADNLMEPFTKYIAEEEIEEGDIEISNKEAKGLFVSYFRMSDSRETEIICGKIITEENQENHYHKVEAQNIVLVYSNAATKISGTTKEASNEDEWNGSFELTIDLNLKTGWNLVVMTSIIKHSEKLMSEKINIKNIASIPKDYKWSITELY